MQSWPGFSNAICKGHMLGSFISQAKQNAELEKAIDFPSNVGELTFSLIAQITKREHGETVRTKEQAPMEKYLRGKLQLQCKIGILQGISSNSVLVPLLIELSNLFGVSVVIFSKEV